MQISTPSSTGTPTVSLRLRAQAEKERRRRQRLKRWQADPCALAQDAGITPDDWQAQVLRSRAELLLILCSRQAGKSQTVALLALCTLLTAESTVVVISPSERQSKELARTIFRAYNALRRPVTFTTATRTSLELANGSRLLAFPGSASTVRGISAVDLLIAEEASQVEDELYTAVSPMLAVSGGRMVALSTPAGRRGWLWNLWSEDEDAERIEVPATRCPRISAAFLERERRRLGSYWFAQEYMVAWQEPQTAAFRDEDIAAAVHDDLAFDSDLFRA